jgi:hypothetical protein
MPCSMLVALDMITNSLSGLYSRIYLQAVSIRGPAIRLIAMKECK